MLDLLGGEVSAIRRGASVALRAAGLIFVAANVRDGFTATVLAGTMVAVVTLLYPIYLLLLAAAAKNTLVKNGGNGSGSGQASVRNVEKAFSKVFQKVFDDFMIFLKERVG